MIVFGLIMTLLFGSMAFGSTPTVDTDHPQTVVVQRGDTLWNIAETVATDDVDIREVVFAMKQMNNFRYQPFTMVILLLIISIKEKGPLGRSFFNLLISLFKNSRNGVIHKLIGLVDVTTNHINRMMTSLSHNISFFYPIRGCCCCETMSEGVSSIHSWI